MFRWLLVHSVKWTRLDLKVNCFIPQWTNFHIFCSFWKNRKFPPYPTHNLDGHQIFIILLSCSKAIEKSNNRHFTTTLWSSILREISIFRNHFFHLVKRRVSWWYFTNRIREYLTARTYPRPFRIVDNLYISQKVKSYMYSPHISTDNTYVIYNYSYIRPFSTRP